MKAVADYAFEQMKLIDKISRSIVQVETSDFETTLEDLINFQNPFLVLKQMRTILKQRTTQFDLYSRFLVYLFKKDEFEPNLISIYRL